MFSLLMGKINLSILALILCLTMGLSACGDVNGHTVQDAPEPVSEVSDENSHQTTPQAEHGEQGTAYFELVAAPLPVPEFVCEPVAPENVDDAPCSVVLKYLADAGPVQSLMIWSDTYRPGGLDTYIFEPSDMDQVELTSLGVKADPKQMCSNWEERFVEDPKDPDAGRVFVVSICPVETGFKPVYVVRIGRSTYDHYRENTFFVEIKSGEFVTHLSVLELDTYRPAKDGFVFIPDGEAKPVKYVWQEEGDVLSLVEVARGRNDGGH